MQKQSDNAVKRGIEIPIMTPHPFKAEFKKANIKLWQLHRLLGGKPSGGHICNMLNGLVPMPPEVENKLQEILAEIKQPLTSCK